MHEKLPSFKLKPPDKQPTQFDAKVVIYFDPSSESANNINLPSYFHVHSIGLRVKPSAPLERT
jgi:hypothetical protein